MNVDRKHIGWGRWLSWQAAGLVYRPFARVAFRPQITGLEQVPDGGYLLLANHTAMLDNLWVASPLHRVVHIMTGAGRFANPVGGALLRWFNCFPKQVGGRDRGAVDQVKALLDAGQVVHIMPEGTRTWDGRLQTIRPTIGALAAACGKPVVLCKVKTGHLIWPRWGKVPRYLPLQMEYQVLETRGVDPDTLWRQIVDGLTLDEAVDLGSAATWARNPAQGLETYLWACPHCFARATFSQGATFGCSACGSRWQVTVDQRMLGEHPTTVRQAWDAIEEHFGDPPVVGETEVLRSAAVITDVKTGEVLVDGSITVDEHGLHAEGWSLPFTDLDRLYMDAGNVVILRTPRGNLKLASSESSTWLWYSVLAPRSAASRAT